MPTPMPPLIRARLNRGMVIPACPLALSRTRQWDPRRQRALFRYYMAAGAGGLAVGVHTTQFAIRDPHFDLLKPLLELARDTFDRADPHSPTPLLRVGGICGSTSQALREAATLHELGFHAGLLSLGGLQTWTDPDLISHCNQVAQILPVIGFYLQPAAGGRPLSLNFWRQLAEIPNVVAVKIAPFNRYQTLDVVRAVVESGRDDIALYTGNDDQIVLDLLTPFRFQVAGKTIQRRLVGGLLGHWAFWTRSAVTLLEQCHALADQESSIPQALLQHAIHITDINAAVFDAAHQFSGCIPGIHEILRRDGLLEGIECLDPGESLSPGQAEELDRVCKAYPELSDGAFIANHLSDWMMD